MKNRIIYTLFLVFFSSFALAQDRQEIISEMIEEVTYLASDKLEGRATGTVSEQLAANYIVSKFQEYSLLPKGDDGFFQYFNAKIKENPHSKKIKQEITGINVVGYVDNNADEAIIIGAHYDHIGYGSFGSRYDGDNEIHNGARSWKYIYRIVFQDLLIIFPLMQIF